MTATIITIILASVVACEPQTHIDQSDKLAASTSPKHDVPDTIIKPHTPQEDQHFCCTSLGGNGSGDGCISIDITHVAGCTMVLYCGGSYENNNGHVTCF